MRLDESDTGERMGGSLSVTVTVNEQRWPDAVFTITLLEPILKKEPDEGVYLTAPQALSKVAAGKVT